MGKVTVNEDAVRRMLNQAMPVITAQDNPKFEQIRQETLGQTEDYIFNVLQRAMAKYPESMLRQAAAAMASGKRFQVTPGTV